MFSPQGPSLRELCVQALSSVERGYDLLAPKFDHTPFRTPESILGASVHTLSELGPFSHGLDVCCGTGAGMLALRSLCQGRVTGVDCQYIYVLGGASSYGELPAGDGVRGT